MEIEIINEYVNSQISIEKLALKYKVGKLKIKSILLNNGININKKGGQLKYKKVESDEDFSNKQISCLKCKKVFINIENKNGAIIKHLRKCDPDLFIPTKYQRYNYKTINGKYWFLDYFKTEEKKINEFLFCPECQWKTLDLNNKTGSFTKHIEKEHGGVEKFLTKYPNLLDLFNVFAREKNTFEYFNKDDNNFIKCEVCGENFKTITNTHLKTHNMSSDDYILKYGKGHLISNTHLHKYINVLKNIDGDSINYRSKGEIEICDFLSENNVVIDVCNKKILDGVELDIFLPEHNIAIEYNGLYWHSEKQGKNKVYHINKTKKCLEKNIRLIHIFSDEWELKKDIIKKRLLNILKKEKKIHGRKCNVVELTKTEKSTYLNINHLQGNDKSNIWIGLKYKNSVVGVMTFGNLRRFMGSKNKENVYELYRYTSNVAGGFSKMLKYFLLKYNPQKIITYSDRNWTPSNEYSFYEKMNFMYMGESRPNYYYTRKYVKREHRYNFSKHKLIKLGYNKEKTETEIMYELGYDRIWDCGNLKYEYKKKGE